jgi:ribosomal protein S18 acetylase RimI-like enzyme
VVVRLRPYRPDDLAGVYRVCGSTDVTGLVDPPGCHDPDLPGHLYAAPYAVADPGLAFVVADELGVAGYVVATADVVAFRQWAERCWWPDLRVRHPRRADPRDGTRDHVLVDAIHRVPEPPEPWHLSHPGELHLKVSDRLQGQGWGRRLMHAAMTAVGERGAAGVHVGVAATNARAIAFYTGLGFRPFRQHGWGSTLVRDLPGGAHHGNVVPAP